MLSMGLTQSYTHTTWHRLWGSGSLVWSKHNVIMSWLRLTATSNCFLLHPCLSTLICFPSAYSRSLTQWYPHWWSWNAVITSWLRLTATSNCFLHSYKTYKVFEHIYAVQAYSCSWQYIMIEADGYLKLLPASTLDKYNVFEHNDTLSIGMAALHSYPQ